MELAGQFQIQDWQEQAIESSSEKLSQAKVKQSYKGALSGTSEVRYQLYYHPEGDAHFNGFEVITLTSPHQGGVLVLAHQGQFKQGVASSQFVVKFCSFDDSWVGKEGSFTSTSHGRAEFEMS